MTFTITALAILVAIYVVRWIREGYAPVRHRDLSPQFLYRVLDALYFRGFSDGEMTITVPPHGQLVVRKHIAQDNDVRLRLDLADPTLVSAASVVIDELGIRRGLSGTPTYVTENNLLRIDFGNDLRLGEQFIRGVVDRAWKADLSQEGYAELKNVAAGNYRIGWTR